MIIRRHQVVIGAVCTFACIMILQRYLGNETSQKTDESHEEYLRQMALAIVKLQQKVDALTKDTRDLQEDPKDIAERERLQGLMKSADEVEKKEEGAANDAGHPDAIMPHKDILNGRLVSSNGTPVKVVVLVGSTARSGTSFLGELLSQYDSFLYLFEPELYTRAVSKEMVTEESGMPHLKDMIHCKISKSFADWLKTRATSFNIFRHPVTRTNCRDWSTCLVPNRLEDACRSEHLRIMKVIRIRMRWMRDLLDDPHLDIKIIHLVRDPRGSLYSMAKNGLHKLEPDYYCPLIEDDIDQTPKLMEEYPGKVMGLTYEGLCLDPIGKATEIWRFLEGDKGAELCPKWATYMEKHMSRSSTKRVAVYGTFRNSSEQYQAWRQSITESALIDIEANCQSVLKALGYNSFGTLERARNTEFPLFINDPGPI